MILTKNYLSISYIILPTLLYLFHVVFLDISYQVNEYMRNSFLLGYLITDLKLQSDWTKFFTAFCEQFQDPNIHDHLTEQLYSLKQTKSVREYTFHFKNLVCKTNQSYAIQDNIFYRNLKDNVKNLLIEVLYYKNNYENIKQTVLEVDRKWTFYQLENLYHSLLLVILLAPVQQPP